MLFDALAAISLVLVLVGVLKRGAPWARLVIILGIALFATAFVLGGGVSGLRAGWRAEASDSTP